MSYTSPIVSGLVNESIDVDFGRAADGADRLCGLLPTPDETREAFRDIAASGMKIYQRSEWPALIARIDEANAWSYRRITRAYDQDGEGTCVYNALALAMQIRHNWQFGDHNAVPLSPISGYRYNAPGPSSGSNVGQAIVWAESKGLIPLDCPENRLHVQAGHFGIVHPATGYSRKPAEGWQQVARMFRAQEWFRVETVEEWVSALLHGFVCVGGRDRHCVAHGGLAMDGGRLLSIYCNSWGLWGSTLQTAAGPLKSFGADSEGKIEVMCAREGWALRTVLKPDWMVAS